MYDVWPPEEQPDTHVTLNVLWWNIVVDVCYVIWKSVAVCFPVITKVLLCSWRACSFRTRFYLLYFFFFSSVDKRSVCIMKRKYMNECLRVRHCVCVWVRACAMEHRSYSPSHHFHLFPLPPPTHFHCLHPPIHLQPSTHPFPPLPERAGGRAGKQAGRQAKLTGNGQSADE